MTQYKSKAEGVSASAGLFTCPALQAADILLYQAEYVPIGDDQRQHVELTRNIAQRFHHLFGPAFTLPQSLILRSVMRAVTDSESEVDPEHISPGADSGAKRAASVTDQTLDQVLRRTGLR